NMQVAVNAWTELGASFATILQDKGPHFVKGGISLKYLAGVANGHISINNLNGSLTEDGTGREYLYNTTGRITTGFGGVDVSDFEPVNYTKRRSTGIGADIGFVYEYRPEQLSVGSATNRDRNKYKWKAGFAILDIGRIKYDKDVVRSGSYEIHITGNERFYLSELDTVDIDGYNRFFTSRPQYFTAAVSNTKSTYNVSLPTTIQLDVDYHLHQGFYAQLAAQLPISDKSVFNSRYYSSITLTPRYEGKAIGVYLPVNYNSLTHFNAGLSLRAGPFFIGSGSILTAFINNAKQADVHAGFHIAGLHKKSKVKKEKKEKKEEIRTL
ncbi:MAG TPA: DUF5723 family protein, partial [Chitinophagaceae bacterium]|nr:DUF5723 family protein [Chitinophagaceae bacterium]